MELVASTTHDALRSPSCSVEAAKQATPAPAANPFAKMWAEALAFEWSVRRRATTCKDVQRMAQAANMPRKRSEFAK